MFYLQPDPANRWFCFVMLKAGRAVYQVSTSLYFKEASAALNGYRAAYTAIRAQRASAARRAVFV